REVVVEPLGDGRLRVDITGLALEVEPTAGGHYLIGPPKPPEILDTGPEGKWERSIKQWVAERLKTTELQSKRAIEYGQAFVTGVITGTARLMLGLVVAG